MLEASWELGLTHDLVEEIAQLEEVVLAHPIKTRLIADTQIKTDRLDAFALATLLRGNLVARHEIEVRQQILTNSGSFSVAAVHERADARVFLCREGKKGAACEDSRAALWFWLT